MQSQNNRVEFTEIDYPPEIEKMAIRIAAYNIIKELEEEGMISEEELFYIRERYQIPVE